MTVPDLVRQAEQLARAAGFPLTREEAGPYRASACLPGTGRFLAVLAAGCRSIAELGTAAGIGTAWLATAMPAQCHLITAELDPDLAAASRELFRGDSRVEVITADAIQAIAGRGPFDLIFADYGVEDEDRFGYLIDQLGFGGRIVMDDVTPAGVDGSPMPARDDLKRGFFSSGRLVSTEVVLTDLRNSLLVGTRIS